MITSEGGEYCNDTCQAPSFRLYADRSLRSRPVKPAVRLSNQGGNLQQYGEYIYDGGEISATDRIFSIPNGFLTERLDVPNRLPRRGRGGKRAWGGGRFQPERPLTPWYQPRVGQGRARRRHIGRVARTRK